MINRSNHVEHIEEKKRVRPLARAQRFGEEGANRFSNFTKLFSVFYVCAAIRGLVNSYHRQL